jgi:PAS domain S-box-containing protein
MRGKEKTRQELLREIDELRSLAADLQAAGSYGTGPETGSAEEASERATLQDVLLDLSKIDNTDFDRFLKTLLRTASETLSVERMGYWSVAADFTSIRCENLYVRSQGGFDAAGQVLRAAQFRRYVATLAERRSIVACGAISDERSGGFAQFYLAPLGITSVMAVPVPIHGRVGGILCHEHVGPERTWTAGEQKFAQSIAEMIPVSLEASKRKKAQDALRESEAKYRVLVENMQDLLWTADLDLNTTYVSPSVERILGFTPKERMDQSISDQLTPESLQLAQRTVLKELAFDKEKGVLSHGPVKLALDFRRKDGSTVCLETVMGFIRDKDAHPMGVYGLSRDITAHRQMEQALRESEKKYRQVVETANDAIYRTDRKGLFTFFNPVALQRTGYSEQDLLGNHFLDIVHPDYRDAVNAFYMTQLRRRTPQTYHELPIVTKSGETFWIGQNVQLLNENDRVVGFQSIARDITDRKTTEQALRKAKEAAEAASHAWGRFLADMSHEIRTPLNAILGMIELLLDTDLTAQQRERVEVVKSSAHALMALLRDILDSSKIKAGELDLEEVDFSLRACLSGAISLLEARAQDKNLELRCHVDDAVPDTIRGDPNRLRQILLNLTYNSVKFTDKGGVLINVDVDRELEDEVILHFSVSGTGIGISEEEQRFLFDRFPYADASISRQYGGTGLGLAISAQLARALGGRMWAESREGRGSTFHFTARFPTGEALENAKASISQEMQAMLDVQGLRVLLAEDNVFNQAVAMEVLKKLGCKVTVAGDGREAVAAFQDQQFDVVLMDLLMPEMDGYEATRLIRQMETGATVPIIAQTALALKEHKESCRAAEIDEYVSKPIKTTELLRAIHKCIRKNHAGAPCGIARPNEAEHEVQSVDDSLTFDPEGLMQRLEGDRQAFDEMVDLFLTQIPVWTDDLRSSAFRNDWGHLARLSHSIKGSCATFGARALRHTAEEMEKAAEDGDAARIQALLTKIDRQFRRLEQSVARLSFDLEIGIHGD